MINKRDLDALAAVGLDSEALDPLQTLRDTPRKVRDILRELHGQQNVTEVYRWIDPRDKQARLDALTEQARTKLVQVQSTAVAANERLKQVLVVARRARDPQAALLIETQEQRAWSRAKDQLVAGAVPLTIIQAAAAVGDVAMLRALRVELPVYLRVSKPTITKATLDSWQAAITDALLPLLLPADRRALEIENEVALGYPNLLAGCAQAQAEIAGTASPQPTIPGWDGQPLTIDVSPSWAQDGGNIPWSEIFPKGGAV